MVFKIDYNHRSPLMLVIRSMIANFFHNDFQIDYRCSAAVPLIKVWTSFDASNDFSVCLWAWAGLYSNPRNF